MFTALISAAIIGALAFFGIKLSIAQIAGVAIVVKIVVVGGIFGLIAKYYRKKNEDVPAPQAVEPIEQNKF
jgi:hypothetical protein